MEQYTIMWPNVVKVTRSGKNIIFPDGFVFTEELALYPWPFFETKEEAEKYAFRTLIDNYSFCKI